jgi:hypothetical protein
VKLTVGDLVLLKVVGSGEEGGNILDETPRDGGRQF